MEPVLTSPAPARHTATVGRKPIADKVATKINLTPEDIAYIEAVQKAFGLSDRSAALRFAVRELCRRDKIKPEEGG